MVYDLLKFLTAEPAKWTDGETILGVVVVVVVIGLLAWIFGRD